MRSLLHSAEFQGLEAAWRGVFFLIRRLETGVDLKLYLFDMARLELAADLAKATDLHDTFLYRKFARGIGGAGEWSMLAANYTFGGSPEDVELLARVALIASRVGAPFLAGASPAAVGCHTAADLSELRRWRVRDDPGAQLWRTLRQMPEAPSLGLALPRFLLRLPYGQDTSSTESFAFEEMAGPRSHEDYLWGNPAFACTCLLGLAFQQFGWGMRPGSVRELTGLPLHLYKEGGEWRVKPCAEAHLSDDAAEAILDQGLIPLIPAKDDDRILAPRLVKRREAADLAKQALDKWKSQNQAEWIKMMEAGSDPSYSDVAAILYAWRKSGGKPLGIETTVAPVGDKLSTESDGAYALRKKAWKPKAKNANAARIAESFVKHDINEGEVDAFKYKDGQPQYRFIVTPMSSNDLSVLAEVTAGEDDFSQVSDDEIAQRIRNSKSGFDKAHFSYGDSGARKLKTAFA